MCWVFVSVIIFLLLGFLFYLLIYWLTFHPRGQSIENVNCPKSAPVLKAGQKLKVLNWNIQYLAGKNYVFWYDRLDGKGQHSNVKRADVFTTLEEVIRVIEEEDPDVVIFQEVHIASKRTHYIDQEKLIQQRLKKFVCSASTYYLKNKFIPLPQIMGAENMKLLTLSKYKINSALRLQLPLIPHAWPFKAFYFKRALFQVELAMEGGNTLSLINTHLDAFAQGTGVMQEQVQKIDLLLSSFNSQKHLWVLGGDFNLLPQSSLREKLPAEQQLYFNPQNELTLLTKKYNIIPSLQNAGAEVDEDRRKQWFTHIPNDNTDGKPDRTIDYILYADNLRLLSSHVRQKDTAKISDHLPLVAEFVLPPVL